MPFTNKIIKMLGMLYNEIHVIWDDDLILGMTKILYYFIKWWRHVKKFNQTVWKREQFSQFSSFNKLSDRTIL